MQYIEQKVYILVDDNTKKLQDRVNDFISSDECFKLVDITGNAGLCGYFVLIRYENAVNF